MALISHLAGREDHPACWPRVSGPRSSGPSPGTSLSGQGRQGRAGAGLTRLETDGGNGRCLGGLADKGTPPPGLTLVTTMIVTWSP